MPLRKKGAEFRQLPIPEERLFLRPHPVLLFQLFNLLKVPRLIHSRDIRVVHCHLHASWLFGLILNTLLPRKQRPRFIFHGHDFIRTDRWLERWLVREASKVGTLIAVSNLTRRQMLECGALEQKIILLRNFLDPEQFPEKNKSSYDDFLAHHTRELQQSGLKNEWLIGRKLVGYAGRLIGYKGWHYFIEIAKRMQDEQVLFLVAGNGPDASKMAQMIIEYGLEERIFCIGYIKDIASFFRFIDVLIIPFTQESFGLVQVEGQASGTPVITFDTPAALEISADGSSVVVPLGNVDAVVNALRELLNNPGYYNQIACRGLANSRLYYIKPYIQRLSQIYQNLQETSE